MDLKVKDVAEMLNISEDAVGDWALEGKIPAYTLDEEWRFSRLEIEGWLMNQELHPSRRPSPFKREVSCDKEPNAGMGGSKQFGLYRAIHRGWVLHDIPGETKEEIFRQAMDRVGSQLKTDPQVILELLLDREKLMPTSLTRGIGVPHTRDQVYNGHFDAVVVVYPQAPIEYGALDKEKVHTLFFLFASSDKRHLHLLAKLAHLAGNEQAVAALRTQPSKSALLEMIKEWETSVSVG